MREGSLEWEGEVKEGWAMAGEVKEEERDLLPVVGREEGEGERGEAKENWGAGLFPDGEKRLTGAAFVLERERERGREE